MRHCSSKVIYGLSPLYAVTASTLGKLPVKAGEIKRNKSPRMQAKTIPIILKATFARYLSLKRFETVYPAVGSSNSAIELTIKELEELLPDATWIDVAKL